MISLKIIFFSLKQAVGIIRYFIYLSRVSFTKLYEFPDPRGIYNENVLFLGEKQKFHSVTKTGQTVYI